MLNAKVCEECCREQIRKVPCATVYRNIWYIDCCSNNFIIYPLYWMGSCSSGLDINGCFVDYSYGSGILRRDVEIALGWELG